MTSTWDIAGRRTRIAHPDGFYVDQDYLVTGGPTAIRENGATSGAGLLATYAWDNLGRRASLTRGDGSVLSYSYDPVSRLTQFADNLVGTAYDQTLGFGYTPASQIASNTRSNDAYAWIGHYNLNRNYTANSRNQYTATGSITPTYDTKGNLTSAGSTTYAYSSENLLTSASGGIALAYDPALRLYQTSGGSAGTTRFAYDGTNLVAEYNSSNTMLRRYVHGPGADEPIVWYEGSGTSDRRFLHADERGSIVAVTNSSGTTLNLNGYNEYGIPSSGNVGRFQYTGQTWLPELGMYYYKARIYSPTLGRFLQTDPIGYGDGMNMYAYVKGDPVNFIDPLGLGDEEIGIEEIITITGQREGRAGGSGGTYPPSGCGIAGGSTPICIPVRGLDDFMYRWWLTGILKDWQVRYDRPPFEPTFYVYEGLDVEEAKVKMEKLTCTDGTTADKAIVAIPDPSRTLIAIAHWHQGRGVGVLGFHEPYPGILDGVVVRNRGIPNYVFADLGLTVVRPGPDNTVAGVDILGNNGLPPGGAPMPAAVTGGGKQCQ